MPRQLRMVWPGKKRPPDIDLPEGYTFRSMTVDFWGTKVYDNIEKFRGDAMVDVDVDETGSWQPELLEYFIRESVGPTLSDYGGSLTLPPSPSEYEESDPC